jgi:DNA polymerase III epsilon subunit-like protein
MPTTGWSTRKAGRHPRQLGALVSAFSLADGLPAGRSSHRASYDALVTARLFLRLATPVELLQAPLPIGALLARAMPSARE